MAPPVKAKRKQSEEGDPLDPSVSPQPDAEQSRSQSPVHLEDSPEAGGEREEEQAFLVSLYKFMKERHTPIERVPHLGFKQINLWKIYKAVEKLGAYEMVTGRRLWKNVYDELGGSPGSTSAATCTRRHYERLVLPYVRHLKGEDDKPLPPSKPRKQYKMAKEPRGDDGAPEKPKKAKEEKWLDQALCPDARLCLFRGQDAFGELLTEASGWCLERRKPTPPLTWRGFPARSPPGRARNSQARPWGPLCPSWVPEAVLRPTSGSWPPSTAKEPTASCLHWPKRSSWPR